MNNKVTTKDFVQHQMLVRTGFTGTNILKAKARPYQFREGKGTYISGAYEFLVKGSNQRVFVVIGGNHHYTKAQIDVIAQLNQIMDNVSIKRS